MGLGKGMLGCRPFLIALGTRTVQNMGSMSDTPGEVQKLFPDGMGEG